MGRRFTWVIVAGVGALLLFAGLDALRSSAGSEDSAPGASTTTTTAADSSGSLLPCGIEDLKVSIEVRAGSAAVVARNFGETCYQLLRGWHLHIEDRAGDPLANWNEIRLLADGPFPAGSESSRLFPRPRVVCRSGGPYLVALTVGPYFARRGHLSDRALGCLRPNSTEVRQELERIGNSWARLFASFGSGSCRYQTQPLCERITCTRAAERYRQERFDGVGVKIRNCAPPTRAFRRLFEGATVEDIVIKAKRAAARFSNGEVVLFVFPTAARTWLVHKLGEDAGRGFFE
jgi:hypothetical protein